jgi:outer membrane immunogenic protein
MFHEIEHSLNRLDRMKRLFKYLASAAMLLSSLAAHSADLAPMAPPLPVPVFSWTGFYVGANVGGAWANNSWTDSVFLTNFNTNNNNSATNNTGVIIGGGQIGGNYQIGNFVIGGEWEFDWTGNSNGGSGAVIPAVGTIVATTNNSWITTVAARFGYAVDHLLLYGKVGGGWVGNNNLTVTNVTTGASLTCGNFTNCGNNAGGWLVGAGGEYAFAPNWSAKFEYDYLGLGGRTFVIPATAPFLAGDVFTSHSRGIQEFKVGVNYLFNWGAPVAARY